MEIWKCPVCKKEVIAAACPECGYERYLSYASYPSLTQLSHAQKTRILSAQRLCREAQTFKKLKKIECHHCSQIWYVPAGAEVRIKACPYCKADWQRNAMPKSPIARASEQGREKTVKPAERNNYAAQRIKGEAYLNEAKSGGTATEKLSEAIVWLKKAAEKDAEACILLAETYGDPKSQISTYQPLRDEECKNYLARAEILLTAEEDVAGEKSNKERYAKLHKRIADGCQYFLCMRLDSGALKRAHDHYWQAFNLGNRDVLYELAQMYILHNRTSPFCTKSREEIITLLEQRTESPQIAYVLGCIYLKQQKQTQAFELFLKAHNQGYPEATRQLGICYRDGIGVEKNPRKGNHLINESKPTEPVQATGLLQRLIGRKKNGSL